VNIVQKRLFRAALSVAVITSTLAVVIFYASGKDREIDNGVAAVAHEKAIYARAAEQGTTYNEIRLRSYQACQMTVPDPPDVGFMFRGAATDAARRECEGSVLYGDHVEPILQRERRINLGYRLVALLGIFCVAFISVYAAFGFYRLISAVWWPWVAGK
jgi:hypothetical protein